jgi:uncharacterized caspase-like protein
MRWVWRVLAVMMLAALVSAPASAQQQPRRVALVIANGAYASANPLTNPANDARLVSNALRQAGFHSVEVKPDLGAAAFRAALRDFRAKAAGADVALVYYAGHGIEANGKNWLIPTDAVLASDLDLTDEAIDLDRVLADVSGAKLRIVVLDACRDNPFGRSWRRGTRAVTRGLGGVDADDVLVIYAAAPGQVASDGPGLPNSPFATALARRLPQPDLPVQVLGNVVRDDVLRATGNVQRPFVSASMTGELYYLVPRTAPQAPASTPAAPPPAMDAATLEALTWQGALAANSIAAFEDYLRQYPQGRFRVQAQQNIARATTASTGAGASPRPGMPEPQIKVFQAQCTADGEGAREFAQSLAANILITLNFHIAPELVEFARTPDWLYWRQQGATHLLVCDLRTRRGYEVTYKYRFWSVTDGVLLKAEEVVPATGIYGAGAISGHLKNALAHYMR